MNRTVHKLCGTIAVIVLVLAMPLRVWSQGDNDGVLDPAVAAILAQLRGAYETTAAQTAYTLSSEDETVQATSVRRLTSGTYLMDVIIFESFVNLQTISTEINAGVNAAAEFSAEIATEIEQEQGLGFEYVRDGEVLSIPDDTESELELNFSLLETGGETYLNSDATGCEFRVGVPEGWRVFEGEGVPVLEDTMLAAPRVEDVRRSITITEIAATTTELLQPDVVSALDVLETEEVNDELARRYLVTLDGDTALAAMGLSFDDILAELETAAGAALAEPSRTVTISYTLEILVGADSGLVYEQISTLQLDVLFMGAGDDSAAYDLMRTNTITLAAYGETTDISVPELGVPDPDETCVQDTTIDDTVDIEVDVEAEE